MDEQRDEHGHAGEPHQVPDWRWDELKRGTQRRLHERLARPEPDEGESR